MFGLNRVLLESTIVNLDLSSLGVGSSCTTSTLIWVDPNVVLEEIQPRDENLKSILY
jgi:hypothetical protein